MIKIIKYLTEETYGSFGNKNRKHVGKIVFIEIHKGHYQQIDHYHEASSCDISEHRNGTILQS